MKNLITLETYKENICIFNMRDEINKNTFTEEFTEEMIKKLGFIKNSQKYKVVVLKGLSNIFCAGAAKSELMKLFKGNLSVKDLILSELILQIPVPVVAAMEGGAIGGGFVVGLCSDIIVMNERGMYGGGFTDLGFTPGMGFTRLLQGLVGEYAANEMLYTGKLYKGKYFKENSLVNYVLPKDEVMKKALYLAEVISEKPFLTLSTLKYSVSLKKRQLLEEARVHEDFMHKITFNQPEVKSIIEKTYVEFNEKL
ncbi:MAG TPA: polyketide synthase [Spirochaetota bacterium]|mgnify:CR=1 FL=1|nr:polyketide synthase [Spirochaetota bacterium]